jgi:hypothetical protein
MISNKTRSLATSAESTLEALNASLAKVQEQLQSLDIFTEFIREMDSIFLPLVDEVGKFLFANEGNY